MSPQKKLMLRRNALFRQQLSTTMPPVQDGQEQLTRHARLPFFEVQHETQDTGNYTIRYSQQTPPPAEN